VFAAQLARPGPSSHVANLGIANTIGLSFTQHSAVVTPFGSIDIAIALWGAVGNGGTGTVTVSNAALGTQKTELRAYTFADASALDPSGVAYDLDSVMTSGQTLHAPSAPTQGTSLAMGFWVAYEFSGEIGLDPHPGWSLVEEWDTVAGGSDDASLIMVERLATITAYDFELTSGTSTGVVGIGAAVADLTAPNIRKQRLPHRSRGVSIAANWF